MKFINKIKGGDKAKISMVAQNDFEDTRFPSSLDPEPDSATCSSGFADRSTADASMMDDQEDLKV